MPLLNILLLVLLSMQNVSTEKLINRSKLVADKPTKEAKEYYQFLKDNYGKKIISSTMANVDWDINEAIWLEEHTGKLPVMAGFDYLHKMLPEINYKDVTVAEDWVARGGCISICWHWNVPTYEGSDSLAFYTEEIKDFSPKRAVQEGTWENDFLKKDMAEVADYLQVLKDNNIPVLWRPFHEAAGSIYEKEDGFSWFWWGTSGGDVYVELWKYMFDYFQERGLNNLIWAWTTQLNDDDYYPGDEYVDLIGRDVYNVDSAEEMARQFKEIQAKYPNKIVALSECGNVPNISDQWEAGAKWSFFMPWYDYPRTLHIGSDEFKKTEHMYAPIEWWKDAINCDAVMMLK